MDYYGLLGIAKNATTVDVNKAFKRLALQFNRKLSEDDDVQELFILAAEAYDVLSNSKLRAVFDRYGEIGLKKGVPTPDGFIPPYVYHGDYLKTYEEFFGTQSPYADIVEIEDHCQPIYNLPEGRGVKNKPEPMVRPIYCTLEEIYQGCIKKMKIMRQEIISSECEGQTELKEKILDIPIKPGLLQGTEITIPEAGDQGPTVIPADIIFQLHDRPHDLFVREGINLIMTVHVTLLEALVGTTVTVKTPDYRTLRIPINDIVHPAYEKIVVGEGMPIVDNTQEKGDLIMRFKIDFPTYLPRASKNLIRKALNVCKMISIPGEAENINLRVMVDKMMRMPLHDDPLRERLQQKGDLPCALKKEPCAKLIPATCIPTDEPCFKKPTVQNRPV
ncbi:UNVERIFIED_CONTAM: hypothetical protein PYX00_007329 [Menopon gallinae]|uniref:J domain-containing protein n=1 Tax=Menopon gallinae TaxID=328185 RepID=A0AAW2HJI0_9NEOP